ncbi:MAG: AAA family ATPase, partial [Candidatus Lokiarchaeota archaeon]|nr:AAA family ATPase [Candidatus Lokiarchaeota archaeon]
MYIPRDVEKSLKSLCSGFPVVAITGPRQSGKSTLVRNVFPDKAYVSLEDLEMRSFATEDPKGFLALYPNGAILDEVQRVPTLF